MNDSNSRIPTDNESREATLIAAALDAPELDHVFAARLEEQLTTEFNQARSSTLEKLLVARQRINNSDSTNDEDRRRVARARRDILRMAGTPPRVRSPVRRLALAAAAAAVLLACVWSVPGYTWNRMVASVREQPWVRVVEVAGQDRPVVWLSTRHDSPRLHREGKSPKPVGKPLRAGERQVTRSLLAKKRSVGEVEAQLFAILLRSANEQNSSPPTTVAVSESRARPVDLGVELDVSLASGAEQVRARFLLDAETRLPLSCEVIQPLSLTPSDVPARRLVFEYPSTGPTPQGRLANLTPLQSLMLAAVASLHMVGF